MELAFRVHESPGRLRLRVPGRRGDAEWLASAAEAFRRHPAVYVVEARARTGSLLVLHKGTTADVEAYARAQALLEVRVRPPTETDRIAARLAAMHRGIATSDPSHALNAGLFYLLLLGALVQTARGKFLPAGEALLLQALRLLSWAEPDEVRPRRGELR